MQEVADRTGVSVNQLEAWAAGLGSPQGERLARLAGLLADPEHPPGANPDLSEDAEIEVGRFVFCPSNRLGLGRVVELGGRQAEVEYFFSVARVERRSVAVSQLVPARISDQTRCYVREPGGWRMGRVRHYMQGSYEVAFPDKESRFVPRDLVYVRCAAPADDPIETLKLKEHETVFFHIQRLPFVHSVLDQRAAAAGLSGLLSAPVNLFTHHVALARQVAHAAVPRCWLADPDDREPATVAGLTLRQWLADDPHATALVVAPSERIDYWDHLLGHELDLVQEGRVRLTTHEEWAGETEAALVLDAAHALAEQGEHDAAIAEAQALLLLSDHTAEEDEAVFARMLHWLDPAGVPDEHAPDWLDRAHDLRERIGQHIDSFHPDAEPEELQSAVKAWQEALADDEAAMEMLDELASLLDEEPDSWQVGRLVDDLRAHLGWRAGWHPRRFVTYGRTLTHQPLRFSEEAEGRPLRQEHGMDPRWDAACETLEAWREQAPKEEAYAAIFRLFVEAAGADLDLLARLAEARKSGSAEGLAPDVDADQRSALVDPEHFAGEDELLGTLTEAAAEEVEVDRLELTRLVLDQALGENDRAVCFVSYPSVANRLADHLAESMGEMAVARCVETDSAADRRAALNRFAQPGACRVLVADRSAESGPPLGEARWVIHVDLPLDPVRIERRIARLDRVGRTEPVLQSRFLMGPVLEEEVPSWYDAWFSLCRDVFGVLTSSQGAYQHELRSFTRRTEQLLLEGGAEALREAREDLQEELERVRLRHDALASVTEVNTEEEGLAYFIDELMALDVQNRELRLAMEPWITKALHFHRSTREGPHGAMRYEPDQHGRTLVPLDLILNRFVPTARKPGTFDRAVAAANPATELFRIGHPFIDALIDYVGWDDRGRSYAIWREVPNWGPKPENDWAGFHFSFVVDADRQLIRERLADAPAWIRAAARRRADALLPPAVQTVSVGIDGEVVTDSRIRRALDRPIQKREDDGYDDNLTKHRLGAIELFVDEEEWDAVADRARERAEEAIRSEEAFRRRLQIGQSQGRAESRARQAALRMRGLEVDSDMEERLSEVVAEAIAHPDVRLDSVGFIVLSGRRLDQVWEV